MFIVEYRETPESPWQRWGSGNTRRTAEAVEGAAVKYLEDEFPQAETRVRRES